MMLAIRRFPRLTLVIRPATDAGDAGSSPPTFGDMRTQPTADAHDAGPRRFPRLTPVIRPATDAGDAGSSPLTFGGMRTQPTADAHDASSPLNLDGIQTQRNPQLMLMMLAFRRFPRLTLVILPATDAGDFAGMQTQFTADAHDDGPSPVSTADTSDSARN
eukprot:s6026_g3.t1